MVDPQRLKKSQQQVAGLLWNITVNWTLKDFIVKIKPKIKFQDILTI